jgi:hypothetical protein
VDDETQDVCVGPFFTKIPKVRWVTIAGSSHMAFFEEPDRYFEIVGKFLTEAYKEIVYKEMKHRFINKFRSYFFVF